MPRRILLMTFSLATACPGGSVGGGGATDTVADTGTSVSTDDGLTPADCVDACKSWSNLLLSSCLASGTPYTTCSDLHIARLTFCNTLQHSDCTQDLLEGFDTQGPEITTGEDPTTSASDGSGGTSGATSTTDATTTSTTSPPDPGTSTCDGDCAPQCQNLEEECLSDEDCCEYEGQPAFCVLYPGDKHVCAPTDGFGKCGWNPNFESYSCEYFGGLPGESDPALAHKIHCPWFTLGEPCDNTSLITDIGCCIPGGYNVYCSPWDHVIVMTNCEDPV